MNGITHEGSTVEVSRQIVTGDVARHNREDSGPAVLPVHESQHKHSAFDSLIVSL